MDIPVPFVEAGETNEIIQKMMMLFMQGRKGTQMDITNAEKKALTSILNETKRSIDGYYNSVNEGKKADDIIKGLDERLSQNKINITTKKLEVSELQTIADSKKSHLEVLKANVQRYLHSARSATLQYRQLNAEIAKLDEKMKDGSDEWSSLLEKSRALQNRFNSLVEVSPKIQGKNEESKTIDDLECRYKNAQERKTLYNERLDYVQKEVELASDRNFIKMIRGVAKYIIRDKSLYARCLELDQTKKVLLQKQADKRASGQVDPLEMTFVDLDETQTVLSQHISQQPSSPVAKRATKVVRFTGVPDGSPVAQTAGATPQPENAYQNTASTDFYNSESSSPPPESSSSVSDTNMASPRQITPFTVFQSSTIPVPTSPVEQPIAEEVGNESDVSRSEEVAPVEEAGEAEVETMDTGDNVFNSKPSEESVFSFSKFGPSPVQENELGNIFGSSQVDGNDGHFGTDAVLNISINSNDPGGDFLALMEGGKEKTGGGADFSFGGMFASEGGTDSGAGGNDFAFDFNSGPSGGGDNMSFNFNFGGGDADSSQNNNGGGFFFPF